jgi:chemotaxis family two-component system response regulator Rcp1
MTSKIKILYVEDSPMDVQFLESAFKKNQINADLFVIDDGDKAIQFIQMLSPNAECWPDAILVDFKLPRNNGSEVISSVFSNHLLREIPVIVFTSSPINRDIEKCCKMGAIYKKKPNTFPAYIQFTNYISGLTRKETFVEQPRNALVYQSS